MPLVTLDGIKVIDVVWMSAGYFRELEAKEPLVLERAPEICVEVLSPSNSKPEMEEKRALYFEAGGKVGGFCIFPQKGSIRDFKSTRKRPSTTSEHIDDNMHVDEAQIDGGDTEAVTASNMENPGQRPIVLERGEVEAL
jgi:hypothetical protein